MELRCITMLMAYVLITSSYALPICDDKTMILGLQGPRNKNDGGRYYLQIPGNPTTYTANQVYNISLKAAPYKAYKRFVISVEALANDVEYDVGRLDLERGEMLAKFSEDCPNTIVESSVVPKTEVQVFWTAPPKGSRCVEIKAIAVESKENWFAEDGSLTRRLCEDDGVNENIQPDVLDYCCACQEAKYEIAFEGQWTRNTHPRHFPSDKFKTGFSEVIGASHRHGQSFWNPGEYASEGLKKLAETGETDVMESELKNNSERIRTIIKARGLQFPNVTKSTYAVFRVDSSNHLVSLVSKIIPSPDWIVGVTNLELCKPDCSWEESRSLVLFPWDVGTDDGLRYTEKVPSQRVQPIIKLTENNPNHPDSPFYSENGEKIKPIARLHLTRQRLYDTRKVCDGNMASKPDNCATTDWRKWSACSRRCGEGLRFRERFFLDDESKTVYCDTILVDIEPCTGEFCYDGSSEISETDTSGEGITESQPDVPNHSTEGDDDDPNCPDTFWGPWTECNPSCGNGYRKRIRLKKNGFNMSREKMQSCFRAQIEECQGTDCDNEEQTSRISSIDSDSIVVDQGPDGEVIDCKVSSWEKWSSCHLINADADCGDGYKIKSRRIQRHPQNGGQACPKELLRKKPCRIPCVSGQSNKCIMGPWSNWTPCSSNCGVSAEQIRTRNIIYKPPGVVCKEKRKERKRCRLPLACTDNGEPIYQ